MPSQSHTMTHNMKSEPIYKTEIVTEIENKLMVTNKFGGSAKLGDCDCHIHTTVYNVDNK